MITRLARMLFKIVFLLCFIILLFSTSSFWIWTILIFFGYLFFNLCIMMILYGKERDENG